MGWNIGVKTNTLKMSEEVAEKFNAAAEENDQYVEYSERYGLLLNEDAMEHMDFLWEDWVQEVLNDPSVNGDVVFMSAEGDNAGDIWGYRFKNGKCFELVANVTLEEVPFGK